MGSFIDTVQQPLPGHVDDPYTEHPDFALAMRTPLPRIASPENPIRNANPTPPSPAILTGDSLPRPSRPSQNYSPSCENGSIAPVKGALVPHSLGEGKRVNNRSYEFQ